MYIACPNCEWQPTAHSHWQCACKHVWNTFDTHGVCPKCDRAWKVTQCLVCHAWSQHEDWYHDDDGGLTVADYLADPRRLKEPAVG